MASFEYQAFSEQNNCLSNESLYLRLCFCLKISGASREIPQRVPHDFCLMNDTSSNSSTSRLHFSHLLRLPAPRPRVQLKSHCLRQHTDLKAASALLGPYNHILDLNQGCC